MFGKGKHSVAAGVRAGGKNRIIRIVIIVALAAALIFAIYKFLGAKSEKARLATQSESTSFVTRGDVELSISGSGTVEPYERYEVISLVNGEIKSAPYDVGDYVEEGDVVYEFDTTDIAISLAKQQNSMKKSTITYNESLDQRDDLEIKAPCSGVVQDITLKAGDEVSQGQQITTIINTKTLRVKLPFNGSQISSVYEGSSAVLTSSSNMSEIYGTVVNVSSTPEAQSDGTSLYYATIEFTNPGAIYEGALLGGSVGGVISPGYGEAEYTANQQVTSVISGTVYDVYYKEGDFIEQDEVLMTLSSNTVENSLKKSALEYNDAKLSLQDQQNNLDDYKLTAPISGTVLTKNSKAGDTIDRTNSSVVLMVIGDVSKLKFNLSIDELDVAKVAVGQKVKVTADAVPNKEFEGEITEIAMEGAATNGVTTYNAVVTIKDPQELKPSMNVDAVIVAESVQNVVRVSSNDVTTAMGKSFVFVKDESTEGESPKKGSSKPGSNARPSGMPNAEGDREKPSGMPDAEGNLNQAEGKQNGGNTSRQPTAPDGFYVVEVETGVVGDEYTEIISGLKEGQEIYQKQVTVSNDNMMFGGMGGGGMHGGNMGGNMGGPR